MSLFSIAVNHDHLTSRGMRKEVQEHITQRALIVIIRDTFDQGDKYQTDDWEKVLVQLPNHIVMNTFESDLQLLIIVDLRGTLV